MQPIDPALESSVAEADGNVYRRRYSRYVGEREGRQRSYMALISHSVRRALGIRRKWTAKIIPIIIYVAAFIPVIGFISIPALFGTELITFDAADLFGAISLILLLFAAAASPEMLCDDRRENVLQLYYARGLSRIDYLAAKLLSLGGLMLSVSLIPALILFLGNTFLEDAPFRALWDNGIELLRIGGTALTLAMYFAAIGLLIGSLTERKGVAAGIYFGVFMAGAAIANALHEALDQTWDWIFLLASPLDIPEGIVLFYFGTADPNSAIARAGIHGAWFFLSVCIVVVACALVLYRRYLREE